MSVRVRHRGKRVAAKQAHSWTEIQLGFSFLPEKETDTPPLSSGGTLRSVRLSRSRSRSDRLAVSIATTRTALLEASVAEVSEQLLPLVEFCEAALTRALDAASTRSDAPIFSAEEYRSLRGIGQAQWLLSEKQTQSTPEPLVRKRVKRKSKESC